ncbi:hypothetical protein LCGC14_1910090 [marine sediment metagenome]|uniref:Uncharacterized protein n=1 Tax=marine sediment metagenome TaxID=412755 RepID=A0A0F9I7V5_9ZZZZ
MLKIGQYVKVTSNDTNYDYTKNGSEGRVSGFATNEVDGTKVAMIRWYKITKEYLEERNPIWPVFPNSLTVIERANNGRLIKGKRYYICDDCGEEFRRVDIVSNQGNRICKKCFKYYSNCKECKGYFLQNTGKKYKLDFYCLECHKKLFVTCRRCAKEHLTTSMKEGPDGIKYCGACYKYLFILCSECETIVTRSEMTSESRGGRQICRVCYEALKLIKHYRWAPRKMNSNKEMWDNGLMMGVELEVLCRDRDEQAKELKDYLDLEKLGHNFYFKDDGTVVWEGHRGFEIVSHPFSLQHSHKHMKWKEVLSWLQKHKFVSYWGGKCGIHVHLSRDFFTEIEIKKLRLFHSVNYEKIYAFAKRGSQGSNYCLQEKYTKKQLLSKGLVGQEGKYHCVNINATAPTVELRMFRGTLNYKRFLATLQFCDALAHFVKVVSAVSLLKKTSWDLFKDWAEKQHRYEHLIRYFETKLV